jgi:hypothetical protein
MDPIQWDDDPSFPNRLPVQVHSPTPGTSSYCRLLGPHQGVFVHAVKVGRSLRPKPHLRANCPHCAKSDKLWRPYIPALLYSQRPKPHWVYIVLELTEVSFRELTELVEPEEFRGRVVEASRGKTKSRVLVRLVENWTKDLGVLPDAFDVRIVLRQLWGVAKAAPKGEAPADEPALPPLQPIELPASLAKPEAPPVERVNFKQLREQHANGNGGAK